MRPHPLTTAAVAPGGGTHGSSATKSIAWPPVPSIGAVSVSTAASCESVAES